MNFNREIIAFRKWVLKNNTHSDAVLLWYALMEANCYVGWKKRFHASNTMLQESTGLSEQGVKNARDSLLASNLITFEKGNEDCTGIYKFVSLVKSVDSRVGA